MHNKTEVMQLMPKNKYIEDIYDMSRKATRL